MTLFRFPANISSLFSNNMPVQTTEANGFGDTLIPLPIMAMTIKHF